MGRLKNWYATVDEGNYVVYVQDKPTVIKGIQERAITTLYEDRTTGLWTVVVTPAGGEKKMIHQSSNRRNAEKAMFSWIRSNP